jgi:hypothetical protein
LIRGYGQLFFLLHLFLYLYYIFVASIVKFIVVIISTPSV